MTVDAQCIERLAGAEVAERISDLLSRWHAWASGQPVVFGYPTVNAACRQARSSRQYDDENGALDAHVDHVLMQAVDAVIDGIPDPWRSVLSVHARNLCLGVQVWSSPRVPACTVQRQAMLVAARKKFAEALARRNLI